MENKEEILKAMLAVETRDNLLCGDIWLNIDYENFDEGLSVQVESKEFNDGSYSKDTFCVFAYENFASKDDKNIIESNFDKTIFKFEFNRPDIDKLVKLEFSINNANKDIKESTNEMKDKFHSEVKDAYINALKAAGLKIKEYSIEDDLAFIFEEMWQGFDKGIEELISKRCNTNKKFIQRLRKNRLHLEFLDGVLITKDNIHLYYEFMNDNDLNKYSSLISKSLNSRFGAIYSCLDLDVASLQSNMKFEYIRRDIVGQFVFGVKDNLKPVKNYIQNIKESTEYGKYLTARK